MCLRSEGRHILLSITPVIAALSARRLALQPNRRADVLIGLDLSGVSGYEIAIRSWFSPAMD
jgi:hypothetical protein